MTTRTLTGIALTVVVAVLLCTGVAGSLMFANSAATAACPTPTGTALADTHGSASDTSTWNAKQVGNAATIITVGGRLSVPARGWIIAVATAMQESSLINNPGGDDDSIGLFQQRPSQGWGTPDQLHDPEYAATRFYQKLSDVPNWQTMTLADAAQAVQGSGHPDAYAKWEQDATLLVNELVSTSGQPATTSGCLSGVAVLARASTWLTAWHGGPVPYLSSGDPTTWLQGYRRDCSGYASMALGLAGPGLNTAALAARSTPIQKTELRPGDLLINPAPDLAGHVVIFDHWADAAMTSYLGYEQSGDGGTHHRIIPYPYFGGYQMSPYRQLVPLTSLPT
ncbi:hypothetical protein GCM10023322_79060 [Rugosimonospora acidiphila]|uniref:NlpC/P60 family protein n=1 Tax=Rugosimonospora acidiphila TaxID=556531 RepID=A0ABP9SU16_9ACTN